MIKWLAILLLIVNVVVFLSRDQQPEDNGQSKMGPPAINLQHMMLSKEVRAPSSAADVGQNNVNQAEVIEDEKLAMAKDVEPAGMVFKIDDLTKQKSGESVQALDEVVQGQQASAKQSKPVEVVDKPKEQVVDSVEVVKDSKTVAEPLQCYRAGPYTSSKAVSKLLAALESLSIVYDKDEKKAASEVKAVRVYLGPFATQEALAKQQVVLKSKKVDAFALKRPGGRVIQLGFFRKQGEALKNAKSMQSVMKAKGLDAKVEVERNVVAARVTVQFKAAESQMEKGNITSVVGSGMLKNMLGKHRVQYPK